MKLFLSVLAFAIATTAQTNPWSKVQHPSARPPEVIGNYNEGCLRGGIPLIEQGPGFQTVYRSSHRYFGHPNLVRFLISMGAYSAVRGTGIWLIDDLGQLRGRPITGHASHEVGLDADVWFYQSKRVLSDKERESIRGVSMLTPDMKQMDFNLWTEGKEIILQFTAEDPHVQRIFVNAVIKKHLCEKYNQSPWLRKLRPWFGHDDHFHVRLYCPEESPLCAPQEEPPEGPGCDGELDEWLKEEIIERSRNPSPEEEESLAVPKECEAVLTE